LRCFGNKLVFDGKFDQIILAPRRKIADLAPMRISWIARTFLFLLAVGLVANTFSGQLRASSRPSQSTIIAVPSALPMTASMTAGMACCVGTPTCASGSGPASICSSGIALLSDTDFLIAAMTVAKTSLRLTASLVTAQTLQPLARPPRA